MVIGTAGTTGFILMPKLYQVLRKTLSRGSKKLGHTRAPMASNLSQFSSMNSSLTHFDAPVTTDKTPSRPHGPGVSIDAARGALAERVKELERRLVKHLGETERAEEKLKERRTQERSFMETLAGVRAEIDYLQAHGAKLTPHQLKQILDESNAALAAEATPNQSNALASGLTGLVSSGGTRGSLVATSPRGASIQTSRANFPRSTVPPSPATANRQTSIAPPSKDVSSSGSPMGMGRTIDGHQPQQQHLHAPVSPTHGSVPQPDSSIAEIQTPISSLGQSVTVPSAALSPSQTATGSPSILPTQPSVSSASPSSPRHTIRVHLGRTVSAGLASMSEALAGANGPAQTQSSSSPSPTFTL